MDILTSIFALIRNYYFLETFDKAGNDHFMSCIKVHFTIVVGVKLITECIIVVYTSENGRHCIPQ